MQPLTCPSPQPTVVGNTRRDSQRCIQVFVESLQSSIVVSVSLHVIVSLDRVIRPRPFPGRKGIQATCSSVAARRRTRCPPMSRVVAAGTARKRRFFESTFVASGHGGYDASFCCPSIANGFVYFAVVSRRAVGRPVFPDSGGARTNERWLWYIACRTWQRSEILLPTFRSDIAMNGDLLTPS